MRCKEICKQCEEYKGLLAYNYDVGWEEEAGLITTSEGIQWHMCEDDVCEFLFEHMMVGWCNEV